jgi:hypothetical protein
VKEEDVEDVKVEFEGGEKGMEWSATGSRKFSFVAVASERGKGC